MKFSTILFVLFLIAGFAANTSGENKNNDVLFKGTPVDLIEQNLAVALRTPSPGVQASASQTVRDLKGLLPNQEFSTIVIPLMGILKDEHRDVAVRTIAALALHDLHSQRGDFAIQQVARFTENQRLAHLCTWLTVERKMKESPAAQSTAMR